MSNEVDMTLFEPEVILPAQMSGGAGSAASASGACALMLAILADAMWCIERGRRRRQPRTRQLAVEAQTWMRSDGREWLFSFASICDVLGIDADALRGRFLSTAEPPANRGGAARTEAEARSTRCSAVDRSRSQRGSASGFIAVDTARTLVRRSAGDREARPGVRVGVQLGAA